jgi:hypothetical protein
MTAPDRTLLQRKVTATLARHTVHGYFGVREDIPLGTEYTIFPDSVRILSWDDERKPTIGVVALKSVWAERKMPWGKAIGWMPLEVFDWRPEQ